MKETDDFSRQCYYVGAALGLAGLLGILVVRLLGIPMGQMLPECTFYRITGLYCPGCGGTRAVTALLKGKLLTSLYDHPFVLYLAVYYAAFMGSHTLALATHGKIRGLGFYPAYFYVGVALILAQWLGKNYLLIRYGISLV
jgi:hypothetical protein